MINLLRGYCISDISKQKMIWRWFEELDFVKIYRFLMSITRLFKYIYEVSLFYLNDHISIFSLVSFEFSSLTSVRTPFQRFLLHLTHSDCVGLFGGKAHLPGASSRRNKIQLIFTHRVLCVCMRCFGVSCSPSALLLPVWRWREVTACIYNSRKQTPAGC